MANLTGFNIGANQRGILNIGSVINTPLDATLRAVTDGLGNSSPLQLSTTDLSVVQGVVSRLLISTDITMRRSDNTLFFQYSNAPDVLELNGNTIRLNTLRGNTAIGHSVAAARLHVRGDGTNPIARFEQLGGTATVILTAGGQLSLGNVAGTNPVLYPYASSLVSVDTSGENLGFYSYKTSSTTSYDFSFQGNNISITSGTRNVLSIIRTFAAGAGSGIFRPLNLEYTINNSGAQTGNATGIFLNATETALNGMAHNLMDLQRGGVSQFKVERDGVTSLPLIIITGGGANLVQLRPSSSGVLRLNNGDGTDFNRLQFGGTTNAFPALKRNGTELQVRLADDSDFAPLRTGEGSRIGLVTFDTNGSGRGRVSNMEQISGVATLGVRICPSPDTALVNTSAQLQVDSTTRGFLPPRMTTAQRDLIGTPAAGLMIYNTTTNRPNFFDGTVWVAL